MATRILDDAREYLVSSVRGKQNAAETRHPWRKNWEFVVLHSFRVETYVLKILAREPHTLTEAGVQLLQLAAILHDIARLERIEAHAKAGAQIARDWLQHYTSENSQQVDIERIIELIADHSHKNGNEPDFSKAVLKDADVLDEVGALSIFMASNWLDVQSPFFFHQLRKRLLDFEIPFCDKEMERLNTNAAKGILIEKKRFIENFISQLNEELQVNNQIESLLLNSQTPG